MDSLATPAFLPMRLSGNQLTYLVDAADLTAYPDRSGLEYKLTLKIPQAYQSGTFVELITLVGRELPGSAADSVIFASFDVDAYLDSLLARPVPSLQQAGLVPCTGLISPYYVTTWIENNRVVIPGTLKTGAIENVLKGKLSTEQFAGWRDQFFTSYLTSSRRFLTWQPHEKLVDRAQPEWLYCLVNYTPKPDILQLRVEITYEDGSMETLSLFPLTSPSNYAVYSAAVGFTQLGLDARETLIGKRVFSYQVWLADSPLTRYTEARTYFIAQAQPRHVRYLVFANSLGGYDTVRFTGVVAPSLALSAVTAQRALPANYLPTSAELFTPSKTADRTLVVNSGFLDDPASLNYLTELALSPEVYVLTREGLVAVIGTDSTYKPREDDEDFAGRVFTFRYAKHEVGYSAMPTAPVLPLRATIWLPESAYCLTDPETGVRTGYQGAATLRLHYTDTNELVKGVRAKPNTPGSDGYYAPRASVGCAGSTTPFLNAALSQAGSYNKSDCGSDQVGAPATITLPAGSLGGQTQAELDARVAAKLVLVDTQAYADKNGSCLTNPAQYTWAVPAGQFHYRTNKPGSIGVYHDQNVWGNHWSRQNAAGQPFVYATGTNDLNFPAGADSAYWLMDTYGPAGMAATLKVYLNGVLIRTYPFTFNVDGFEHHLLLADGAGGLLMPASMDKLYVLLTY